MRQTIAGLALLVGLTGCKGYDSESPSTSEKIETLPIKPVKEVIRVGSDLGLTIPPDCQEVVDVRYNPVSADFPAIHQVLCKNKDKSGTTELKLYWKQYHNSPWTSIHYRR